MRKLSDADKQVTQRVGVQDVGVVDHDKGHDQYSPSSSLSSARSSAAERRFRSSWRLYSMSASKVIRRCLPTLRKGICPDSSRVIRYGRDTFSMSAACWVVGSASL